MKRILLILSHSIEEHDQLKLLSGLGYEVFSLGGYINPHEPHDPKRPALMEVPHYADLQAVVDAQEVDDNIGAAASHIPGEILEWLGSDGVIIAHHYLEGRIYPQWEYLADWRAKGGRVIRRTVGQSVEPNEREAQKYVTEGMETVRYSPNERAIPGYSGENALIRFYKDPDEWGGYTGDVEAVTNITQDLLRRTEWCNAPFWIQATEGLPVAPLGPGSDLIGGPGEVPFETMKEGLRRYRCYLYTGTQPASYTLGLIEAMMTGIPVVCIGNSWMRIFPYGPGLFEASDLCKPFSTNDPLTAREWLQGFLSDQDEALKVSQHQRFRAIKTFGKEEVGKAWQTYLG